MYGEEIYFFERGTIMKYKKYVLLLLLVIFIGLNRVEAADEELQCYYIGEGFKARLTVNNNGKKHEVIINNAGGKLDADPEKVLNWGFSMDAVSAYNGKKCPKYLILDYYKSSFLFIPIENYNVYGTDDVSELNNALSFLNGNEKTDRQFYGTYLHTDGTPITKDEYYGEINLPSIPGSEDNCDFNDENCVKEQCKAIFGEKTDENSLAYLINKILGYVRIIVPILVIILGILDFAKAVFAGKEDEMKKAQTTFIKRLIIGILVFFVPVLVNLIMSFADMIWENYGSCGIESIMQ